MTRRILLIALELVLSCAFVLAQSRDDGRIARLSYVEGRVSFQHPNEVDWSAASVNMALAHEDRIYTGDNGRAEIEFDDGSILRLASKTDVEILSLKEELIQFRILLGLATLTVKSSTRFEVNSAAAAFSVSKKGIYRFDVAENGDSDAIVRKGRLEAANSSFTRQIDSGEMIHITAGDRSTNLMSRYDKRDTWDEWTDRRDADLVVYESRRYLPDTVSYGVRELDRYGRWVVVDAYGPAWVPYYVDTAWSPYWVGRWWYRPIWGWTWVSYEPWGWLPYHYGRWHHSGSFGWCWLPGPSFGFHFWSPGLVRFYSGPSWVSWCPLGPGDYYNVNHYRYNTTYNYHITNIRMMQNRAPGDLANRNIPGAFRTVATDQFVNGALGGRGGTAPGERVDEPWKRGRMVTDRLDVQPTSKSFEPAPDRPAIRPASVSNLPAIVRTTPSAVTGARDRFVPISGRVDSGNSSSGSVSRATPADVESAGRSNPGRSRGEPVIPTGSDAARSTGGSSIGNRYPDRSVPESTSPGRIYRNVPSESSRESAPRVYGGEVPAGSGRTGDRSGDGRSSPSPSRSIIEGSRSTDREMPRNANPRPEYAPPTRRMETGPTSQPGAPMERPSRSPESRPEQSRPAERSKPPGQSESSYYSPRSIPRGYDSIPSYGIQRTQEWGQRRESFSARAEPSRPWGGGSITRGYSAPSVGRTAAAGGFSGPGTASTGRTPAAGGFSGRSTPSAGRSGGSAGLSRHR